MYIQTDGGSGKGITANPPDRCQVCNKEIKQIAYDAKTIYGPWAWLCPKCFGLYGIGLGLGRGQMYTRV